MSEEKSIGDGKGKSQSSARYASQSTLGKASDYRQAYNPALLHPIERKAYRESIFLDDEGVDRSDLDRAKLLGQIAKGVDVWHAYEVSCLLASGRPVSIIAKIQVPADSQYIVESKSLKLYFNSWNNHRVASKEAFEEIVSSDISKILGVNVAIEFADISERALSFDAMLGSMALNNKIDPVTSSPSWQSFICLDKQDVPCDVYAPDAGLLEEIQGVGSGYFYSHLLRSNCPVTDQPDWATVVIAYDNSNPFSARDGEEGADSIRENQLSTLCPMSLLRYIVSYREHNGFHEQTVEKIFCDLLKWGCKSLFVAGMYSRRGGIDITPIRTTGDIFVDLPRHTRL